LECAESERPQPARRLRVDPKTWRGWVGAQVRAGDPLLAAHERYGRCS
jgi:hypothetical protein